MFLRRLIDNRWFAFVDLLLVMMSGLAWVLLPKFGILFTLIALLPWGLRLLNGGLAIKRIPFSWLMPLFIATGWVAYWAAYDPTTAWVKFWLIVTAVLLFYALSAQPKENLGLLSFLSLCFALALSSHFLLTYDFTGNRGGIAVWWSTHRPQVSWPATHHGYTSGLLLISSIFAFYWLWVTGKKFFGPVIMRLLLVLGLGIVTLVFLLTLSRGIEVISIGVVGLWILWKVSTSATSSFRARSAFPVLVLVYMAALIVFAYLGPARAAGGSTPSDYGSNSRAELFGRGAYFLADYPLTGGGLNSFPGLYSQYMLAIPQFYFMNSYNLFLDVAIEQGLIAGALLTFMYFGTVWLVSKTIVRNPTNMMNWLSLTALIATIVHGLFYDYLYNGSGTLLLFFPLGMAIAGMRIQASSAEGVAQLRPALSPRNRGMLILIVFGILIGSALQLDKIKAIWYGNLGALQMSRVELMDFPTNQWANLEMVPRLEMAEGTLRSALRYDPTNQTANYRLGLISMLRRDFTKAAAHLNAAHLKAPNHRGIIKNLAYCYTWLGETEKAQALLDKVPEARSEMSAYTWWWGTEGRSDLSHQAAQMISRLEAAR